MIRLDLNERRGLVEPEMFGCLIEHYGTLYDGIWVADTPGTRRSARSGRGLHDRSFN